VVYRSFSHLDDVGFSFLLVLSYDAHLDIMSIISVFYFNDFLPWCIFYEIFDDSHSFEFIDISFL
jgi:hypothetical protein